MCLYLTVTIFKRACSQKSFIFLDIVLKKVCSEMLLRLFYSHPPIDICMKRKNITFKSISFYRYEKLLVLFTILSYDELKMEDGPIICIHSGHMSGRS